MGQHEGEEAMKEGDAWNDGHGPTAVEVVLVEILVVGHVEGAKEG